jgi:antitoxin YefM
MYAILISIATEESQPSVPEPVSISLFRQKTGPYFTEAVHRHSPLAIQRGSEDLGLLLGRDEAWALLANHSFTPEVVRGDGGVSIWLPELAIYGQGATFAGAKADLLEEVRVYIDEYLANAAEYLRAPNRETHLPHVIKAYLADLRGELEPIIFPGPPDLSGSSAEAAGVPAAR